MQPGGVLLHPLMEDSVQGRSLLAIFGLVMLEQMAGLFSIAMVVTRLIGMRAARAAARHEMGR